MAHKCLNCDRWIANRRKNKICSYCQAGEPIYIKVDQPKGKDSNDQ